MIDAYLAIVVAFGLPFALAGKIMYLLTAGSLTDTLCSVADEEESLGGAWHDLGLKTIGRVDEQHQGLCFIYLRFIDTVHTGKSQDMIHMHCHRD